MSSIQSNIKPFILFLVLLTVYNSSLNAQLKVGNNPTTINPNAILEMQTTNKGMLLPRVALIHTTSPSPLSSFVNGMLVYDTVTAGDVTPGMYYCDGTKWIKLNIAAASMYTWNTTGNSDTDPSTNFIGTTDNNPLLIKTNGNERVRITRNGRVGIGTNNPGAALDVNGQVIIGTLLSGNVTTDSLLVADPTTGLIKKTSFSNINTKVLKAITTVVTNGQTIFNTPATITDINKISLYRNGVMISFTINTSNTIIAELPCVTGDELRIIQLL